MPNRAVPVEDLRRIVGEQHVLTDPGVVRGYSVDWTGRFRGATPAVVRPASTGEVAEVLALLERYRVPVVPQGGNTGLVGGGVPLAGEVVLSLTRMRGIEPVDVVAGQVTVDAGVTLGELDAAAAASGLAFGVDIAAKDVATVGGAISTNAGGLRMLRHGNMARQVLGVEAVLSDGSVVSHLAGLTKDNTGYPLHALLCGAEGTLAVLTRARLRLVPRSADYVTALVGLPDVAAAVALAGRFVGRVPSLEAVELMLAEGVDLVREHLWVRSPLPRDSPAYLLVEAAGNDDVAAVFADLLDDVGDDVALALDPRGRRDLWALRERHPEAIARAGTPIKLDLSVPLAAYATFADEVRRLVHALAPEARVVRFGHVADGNLHVNVLGAPEVVEQAVFELVAAHGGSISAEHGIGTAKKPWLHLNRSAAELRAGAAIKAALDPHRILNPQAVYAG